MIAKLTDQWFAASFLWDANEGGGCRSNFPDKPGEPHGLDGAQGIILWCPCGFADPKYHAYGGGRPHAIEIPFANPRNAPLVPAQFGMLHRDKNQPRPRWTMSGTSLADLTLMPSVDVGQVTCWHGFITNGDVL